MSNPLGVSPSKGEQGTTRGKENLLTSVVYYMAHSGDAGLFSVKTNFRSLEFKGFPPGVCDDASNSARTS